MPSHTVSERRKRRAGVRRILSTPQAKRIVMTRKKKRGKR